MVKVSVGIDVPSLEKGVGFYSAAFGFSKVAEPVVEQRFNNPKHGSAAFCSDPFGHGFCLIERVR